MIDYRPILLPAVVQALLLAAVMPLLLWPAAVFIKLVPDKPFQGTVWIYVYVLAVFLVMVYIAPVFALALAAPFGRAIRELQS